MSLLHSVVDTKLLNDFAVSICNEEQEKWELVLCVLFCGSERMRYYNRSYRGQDKATDILSFTFALADEIPVTESTNKRICDIIIDINQVDKQKGTNSFEQELIIVFVHGILHLMGYDHIKKADKQKMEEKASMYLSKIQQEKASAGLQADSGADIGDSISSNPRRLKSQEQKLEGEKHSGRQ